MVHRRHVVRGAIVAALAVAVGAGPAAAEPAEAPAPTVTGWVIENPRADGLYDTFEGSTTIVLASGETVSCPLIDGWGRAHSGTVRPQDWFAVSGVTAFDNCTGPGAAAELQVWSSPEMVFAPDAYDAAADRIMGTAYAWTWGLFLETPDCQVDVYAADPDGQAPLTYDNPTATLDTEPLAVVATRADGPGCAGLAQVGDELTFETTFVATPGFTVRPA